MATLACWYRWLASDCSCGWELNQWSDYH